MPTINTDRYAVQVWLPAFLGVGLLAIWSFGESSSKELVLGLLGLAWSGAASIKRMKTPPELR